MISPEHKAGFIPKSRRRAWAASFGLISLAFATILGFAFFSTDDCTTVTVMSLDGSQTISRTCT